MTQRVLQPCTKWSQPEMYLSICAHSQQPCPCQREPVLCVVWECAAGIQLLLLSVAAEYSRSGRSRAPASSAKWTRGSEVGQNIRHTSCQISLALSPRNRLKTHYFCGLASIHGLYRLWGKRCVMNQNVAKRIKAGSLQLLLLWFCLRCCHGFCRGDGSGRRCESALLSCYDGKTLLRVPQWCH